MGDEHSDLARKARHSTTSDAIQTGRYMKASFTLLNHFSQRYGRLPPIDTFDQNVAASFDFMRVKFRDLYRLSYYIPYYQYAFAKHWTLIKSRTDAYVLRKLREADELLEGDCTENVDDDNIC
uniref:ribonuclease Z n=1 Tax=Schistosoma japonicum TaxID=6182 RepID=Q86EB3_SCHJA|nr:similar to GenBank Accession Number AF308694 ELAC2 in Gorilla gorilla [Schistosoma japonicum]